jgi:hypothetical protein
MALRGSHRFAALILAATDSRVDTRENFFPIACDPPMLKTGISPERPAARFDERSLIRVASAERFASACGYVDRKQLDMA